MIVTSPPTDVNGHSGAWGARLGSRSIEMPNGRAPGANGMSISFLALNELVWYVATFCYSRKGTVPTYVV